MKLIILVGGSGTRLFPFSRRKFPKQFLSFGDDETLFQKTIKRSLKVVKDISDIIVVTNDDYQFYVKNQIEDISGNIPNIVLEPVGRNTAPAIALAAKYVLEELKADENEVLFISPSDHLISQYDEFAEYVRSAEKLAEEGYIVTFGVNPTKPETGYGYIEAGSLLEDAYMVKQFHEKPNLETARRYLMSGNYYWNSGMFAFSIKTILEEFEKYTPEIYKRIKNLTFEEMTMDFENMPSISIDYAVMEKTNKAVVLPLSIMWSDVGSWDSVYDILEKGDIPSILCLPHSTKSSCNFQLSSNLVTNI